MAQKKTIEVFGSDYEKKFSNKPLKRISGYFENWDSIGFEDRRLVVDGLVSIIRATSESVQIEWKI